MSDAIFRYSLLIEKEKYESLFVLFLDQRPCLIFFLLYRGRIKKNRILQQEGCLFYRQKNNFFIVIRNTNVKISYTNFNYVQ